MAFGNNRGFGFQSQGLFGSNWSFNFSSRHQSQSSDTANVVSTLFGGFGTKRKTDETESLSEKSFAECSHKIGKEWIDVLVHLGTSNAKIEQYNLDCRYTHEKIYRGLCEWNARAALKTPVERFVELCKALQDCELQHIIDEIYAKYFPDPASSSSSKTEQQHATEDAHEHSHGKNRFTITGKVIRRPTCKPKRNQSGKQYTTIVVGGVAGTNDRSHTIRNYRYRSTYVKHGCVYKFINMIWKEGEYWIVRGSEIQQVTTTDQDGYPRGTHRSIAKAMNTCQRSTIIGQIYKVSEVRMQKHGTLPVKTVGIEDDESRAELILFAENAKKHYTAGMVIEATSVYGMLDGLEIRTTHYTAISNLDDE